MNKYLPLVVIAIIAVAIGAAVALMGNREDSAPASGSTNQSTSHESTAGSSPQNSNQPATVTDEVEIENFEYLPANITVKKGTTVTWTNKDRTEHTVTGRSGNGPKSGSLNRDDSYSFTFNETGEFEYFCIPHPSMTGKVTVTD